MAGRASEFAVRLNLSREAGNPGTSYQARSADNPFTVFEFEHVLRPLDGDSQELPQRLWQLLGMSKKSAATQAQWSRLITTDSWDPPVPGTTYPPAARQAVENLAPVERYSSHHITEMLTAALVANGLNNTQANANIRDLLPEDLIAGLRMNINRPLGDVHDSDGNGIVDEPTPSELSSEGQNNRWTWATVGAMYSNFSRVA